MRLILVRAASARTLLVAASFAATVTTVLLTAFALYAQLLPVAGARAAVTQAGPLERSLLVAASAGRTPQEFAARDAAVRELLGDGVAGVTAPVAAGGYASGQELPGGLAPDDGSAVIAFLPQLPEHARLVAGDWPGAAAGGEPVPAALPAAVASALGLAVGDEVAISDRRGSEPQPAPVVLVGVWEPLDAADPYWQLAAAPLERGGWGPFVVPEADFVARYHRLAHREWLLAPDPGQLAEVKPGAVVADLQALRADLPEFRETHPDLDSSVRLRTELDELAARLATASVVNRSGLVLPAALLAVIAGYGLVLVARLLTAHRRGENALLRARGASRRQLVRFTAGEAMLVVAPAALLGAPLGTALVSYADQRSGDRSLAIAGDLAGYGVLGAPLAWLVTLLAAAGCALALALPAAGRGRTWVAEQQERSRPSRAAALQRAGLDVALVVLAILAASQLRQYGTTVTPSDAGLGIDPLLVAAPVVGVLAATTVALRLLPLATRLGVRLAAKRDGFPSLLGMWQADRRPHAGPVLLLVLAVAAAVLAPAVASTWQQSQRDQAAQLVGADLRVTVAEPGPAAAAELQDVLPATAAMMPVHRGQLRLPEVGAAPLLALDTADAAQVALLRPDLAPAGVYGLLRNGRPELTGLPLPTGAERLVGRFRFEVPAATGTFLRPEFPPDQAEVQYTEVELDLPAPLPDRLSVNLLDARGVVTLLPVGQLAVDEARRRTGGIVLDDDGELALDVALPPDAVALVGIGAGLTAPALDPNLLPDRLDQVPVSWRFEDLRVVDGDGAETPLQVPAQWQVLAADETGPQVRWQQPAARVTLSPENHYPASMRFLLVAPPPEAPPIPIVVSEDLLAATGGEVGRRVRVEGEADGLSSARVVAVVSAVPGTTDGSGVLVDLAWLSTEQFLAERRPPTVNEWWVAEPGEAAAAVAQLGWAGGVWDRQVETGRLLGDPLGTGVLLGLWAAAGAAGLLAAFGLVVDSRATAVRRRRELAVLHTLGTAPRMLARALVVEQAVLAGLGVLAGLAVGVAVAAAMAPSLVLTAAGAVPVPAPLLSLAPLPLAAPTVGLLVVAVLLGALVARRARREVAAGALRIGED